MGPRRATALLAAAASATALAGCGGSSAAKDDAASGTPATAAPATEFVLAKAATATEQARTAAVAIEQRISGAGLPKPVELTAKGTTSLTRPELDLTYDLAPLLSLAGQSGTSDATARILVDGSRIDVKPPKISGFELPAGATWVRVDLRQAVTSLGLDPDALAATAQFDPASQLKRLQTLKGVKRSGTATVDGTRVTRYVGSVTARDALATLPADQRAKIEKALTKLSGGAQALGRATQTEIDVDDQGLVRRQTTSSAIPDQGGAGAGKIDQTITYSDFGSTLAPPTPPAADVFDATSAIKSGLGGALAAGAGAGSTTG